MQDCDFAVGGTVATAMSVTGNVLKTSGSKGETIKGVTGHLERVRETGSRLNKRAFSNDKKCRLHKSICPGNSSLIDASFKMTGVGVFTMISRVVVVRRLGGLLCAVGPIVSLFNLSSLRPSES